MSQEVEMSEEDRKAREEGIKAIIYLQASVGKVESEEKAGRAWDRFARWEKDQTMAAYGLLSRKNSNVEARASMGTLD